MGILHNKVWKLLFELAVEEFDWPRNF